MPTINVPVVKQYSFTDKSELFRSQACAACCIVAASTALGNTSASMKDAISKGCVNGDTGAVTNWNYKMTVTNQSGSESDCFSKIVNEILAGRPVIIKVTGSSNTHYVTAYGYIGDASRADRIYVMDPYLGNCTLQDTYNTYGATSPKKLSYNSYKTCTRA